jgi:ElaB/YqjD/DUF883 family membrane-anchored ribosome-binding protein
MDELKNMQREAAELKAERKRPRPTAKSAAGKKSRSGEDRNEMEPPVHDSADEEQASELDKSVQDLASHLESAGKEIEEAAREHPVLALLMAFTFGIVVGHLLSRR